MVKHQKNYLAMDFGASTGRGILGQFDGEVIRLKEVHRFQNYYVNQNGTYFWDVYRLLHEIIGSLKTARKQLGRDAINSIGIDTWGTDYGLLDQNGQLLGNVRCMRNADGKAVEEVEKQLGLEELFRATGLQMLPGNTLFQLYERMQHQDPALKYADKMLMLPNLLGYFLTGLQYEEYTMASTSMCLCPINRIWNEKLLDKLGLSADIFAPIRYPGEHIDPVLPELISEIGVKKLDYISVGTHDTASAIAAAPLKKNELFCSSGTWSVFGIETMEPVLTEKARKAGFANEGTIDGKYRLLKNIMGMWLIQECVREWQNQNIQMSWDEVVEQAKQTRPFESMIDTALPELYNAGNMIAKLQNDCRRTGQKVPRSIGEIARCIYQSIALQYRLTMDQLIEITGECFDALHIIGGGCQNRLLNQFTANALNIPVHSGPVEAASVGNILAQAMSYGELTGVQQLRDIVGKSFEEESFYPENQEIWHEAYIKYCELIQD